eukprot:8865178-Pyramimonas_sp.AAC.1
MTLEEDTPSTIMTLDTVPLPDKCGLVGEAVAQRASRAVPPPRQLAASPVARALMPPLLHPL